MSIHFEAARTIIIIGGGASGVLLAANLLRSEKGANRILIVEKASRLGAGMAYSTQNPNHILNVPAQGMSAFPDQPNHFVDWLHAGPHKPIADDPLVFAPRQIYSQYLTSLIEDNPAITFVNAACEKLVELPSGVEARLDNGTSLIGHSAVLAVGHEERQMRGRGLSVRAGSRADTPIDPYAKVMILGSGLSMVDAWLSLAGNNHLGPILVVSRNGLFPKSHAAVVPFDLDPADIPLGTSLHYFMQWFRSTLGHVVKHGGDWRSVVDGIRPYNQKIWQNWTLEDRRRFLTHVRPYWNIHRHRLPPALHARLAAAASTGQLTKIAGTFLRVTQTGGQLTATVRRRGLQTAETFEIERLYDCGGVAVNIEESSNTLIKSLVWSGQARADPLKIGLDVTPEGALIGSDGRQSQRLFALGPLTRSMFFEIESVPEIRVQALAMARRLTGPVAVS